MFWKSYVLIFQYKSQAEPIKASRFFVNLSLEPMEAVDGTTSNENKIELHIQRYLRHYSDVRGLRRWNRTIHNIN